jgi:hypothetical protein
MLNSRFFLSIILVIIIITPLTPWAETQVSISSLENVAFIGDRIHIKIIVKSTTEIDDFNPRPPQAKDYAIILQEPTEKRRQQDYLVIEKNIELAFFKTGDFDIGPFNIEIIKDNKVIESRETNLIPITIKSVLKLEDKDIKSLKNLAQIKGNPLYLLKYIIAALVLIILIIIIVSWLQKRSQIPTTETKPQLSPLDEFKERFRKLTERNLFERGKIKLYFIELTQIIKHFLHRNYDFNAEDFTTYETLQHLKKGEKEPVILNGMEFLFNTADLVKFAKFIPDERVFNEVIKRVNDLILFYRQRLITNNQEKPL